MPTGERCKAGQIDAREGASGKNTTKGWYSRGVLVAWQFRARGRSAVGSSPVLCPFFFWCSGIFFAKSSHKTNLKGATCSGFHIFKSKRDEKNDFGHLGMSKSSGGLAASHEFVFVLWLYLRGHTCWTWFFFTSAIVRRSKRFSSIRAGRTELVYLFSCHKEIQLISSKVQQDEQRKQASSRLEKASRTSFTSILMCKVEEYYNKSKEEKFLFVPTSLMPSSLFT